MVKASNNGKRHVDGGTAADHIVEHMEQIVEEDKVTDARRAEREAYNRSFLTPNPESSNITINVNNSPDPAQKNNTGGLMSREGYQVGQLVGATEENETAPVDTYPNIPQEEMEEAEASQLPDEEMEGNYLDFIIDESLVEEEQTYLMNALEADPQLSVIFDKVVDTASEFSGAGEVIGPGTGVSDSIPARLSDGEFVMTRKATDAIGPDNLQVLMDDAEMAYDYDGGRELKMAFGGVVEGDDEIEDSKDSLSQTDEEIRKVMIGSNRMPSVR